MAKKDEASILDYIKSKFSLGRSSSPIKLPTPKKPAPKSAKAKKASQSLPERLFDRRKSIAILISIFALLLALFAINDVHVAQCQPQISYRESGHQWRPGRLNRWSSRPRWWKDQLPDHAAVIDLAAIV